MTYTFARVGAVVGMTVDDYYSEGKRWWLRLHEKGGKHHEMPAHHKLEAYIDEYLDAAQIRGQDRSPLFPSTIGKTGILTGLPMHRIDVYRMIRRRMGCGAAHVCGFCSLSGSAADAGVGERSAVARVLMRLDEVERILI
jgi:integrase